MSTYLKPVRLVLTFATALLCAMSSLQANAETAAEIDGKVDTALEELYKTTPAASELSKTAKGILVFPDIIKAGLIVGGQYGTGALRVDGKTTGYYNSAEGSFGLQAGAQKFGYALFFMSDESLAYLTNSKGWELGVGPNIVVMDEGKATAFTTTTMKDEIYAFFFDQEGLMAGLGIQGSKITKITPDK